LPGGTPARAHARSGESTLISSYLGKADIFDRAIAAFAIIYADQVESDYEAFAQAVSEGKLEARIENEDLFSLCRTKEESRKSGIAAFPRPAGVHLGRRERSHKNPWSGCLMPGFQEPGGLECIRPRHGG
jgi:hypothetical protein